MGLLKLADDNSDVDFYEYRDQHYYNKYEYRARFNLVGVRYTWYIKSDIQELVERLEAPVTSYHRLAYERDEVRENLAILASFLKWRNELKEKKNSTIRIEHNTVGVFSNDLQELKNITTSIPGIEVDYTQAQISNYIGIKHFMRKPKHKFRIYLKSRRVEGTFAEDLYTRCLRKISHYTLALPLDIGPKVVQEIKIAGDIDISNASHFIDYDDESVVKLSSIVIWRYARKTL
jgi:hypothetical protein